MPLLGRAKFAIVLDNILLTVSADYTILGCMACLPFCLKHEPAVTEDSSLPCRTPQSFAQASLSLSSLPQSPGEAVRHLHFNPVYSEPGFLRQLPSQLLKGSGRPLRSAGQENKAATPSGNLPATETEVACTISVVDVSSHELFTR